MSGFWMQQSIILMSVWFRPVFYLKCAVFECDSILKELNIENCIMRSLLYGRKLLAIYTFTVLRNLLDCTT